MKLTNLSRVFYMETINHSRVQDWTAALDKLVSGAPGRDFVPLAGQVNPNRLVEFNIEVHTVFKEGEDRTNYTLKFINALTPTCYKKSKTVVFVPTHDKACLRRLQT